MKKHILHFFTLFTFVIFVYASVMQGTVYGQNKFRFSTEDIRAMWFMCATQFQKVAPIIPQIERVRLCDCYVDYMRNTYTSEQVKALTSEEIVKLGIKMNIICPTQAPFSTKEIT